ncbi:MAG: wax ester/triacylglycerol synthase family O-acyltransferase, partial [Myxococcota bacterium]|nr:wax ester/triacylglycerol synthase family O-acyltransferase [Myxococcota bacterium]
MVDAAYERLSAQDATFLDLEEPSLHQHIAATTIFDARPLLAEHGGVDIDRIRDYVESRLHLLPRYRQRLSKIPIENHPVWVDDPHFRIEYHVRHSALPRPGDERQLKRLTGRLLSQPLDRSRPLWELWFVEGLEGDRCAIVSKVHHCMIDGISGVDLLGALLTPEPTDEIVPGPEWAPRSVPGGFDLATTEIARRAGSWIDALGRAPEVFGEPRDVLDRVREGAAAIGETLAASFQGASATPLNQPLGPHRRFDWMDMDLEQVKSVKRALGGTVNDVVLATVAGALRRFFELRRIDPDRLRIRANVPVSVRNHDERGTLGNRIALLMADLPVNEPEAFVRLQKVRETMGSLKESRQALGGEVLAAVSEWTSATLLSLAVRGAMRGRPYNLVVTNVPGPQMPLYLLGGRLLTCYPVVNLLPEQALGVALFSYSGTLYWGFTADWDLVPDLHEFVRAVQA